MRKTIFVILVVSSAIFISCDDNLSPKTPFTEQYALYCVLNTDTTYQTAYISKSYDVEGFDPLTNTTDPALEGADIRIRVNGQAVYNFTETTTARTDTSRYKTPVKYYELNNLKINDNDRIEIWASLRNGKILWSYTQAPPNSLLYFETATREYFPSVTAPQTLDIKFGWTILGSQYGDKVFYFYPQLELVYSKADNPGKLYRKIVPKMISASSGSVINPTVTSNKTAYFYYEAIVKAFEVISEGDPQKSNYIIHNAEFTLLFLDRYSASYMASASTFRDEFSMRIDAPDYTNIQNGYGVFGVYSNKKVKVNIARTFINSFGYRLGQ